MGFLDFLKGAGTGDATVTLDVAQAELLPGGRVELKATVEGEIDDKVENLQLGVRCVNKYKRMERDSDGDLRKVTTTETLYEDIRPVTDGPPSVGTHTLAVELPQDAMPSAEDAIEWEAVARIARNRGRDVGEEQPLNVLSTAERHAGIEQKPPVASGARISARFEELTRSVRVGEKVSGVLVVTAQEDDLKANETRVNLTWRRTDSAEVYNWDGVDIAEIGGVKVSLDDGGLGFYAGGSTVKESGFADNLRFDEIELPEGHDVRFPFTLALPVGSPPTLAGPHTAIQWRVEAVLSRRMKDDIDVGIELNVFTAPRG